MSNLKDFVGNSLKWWDEIYTTPAQDTGNGVVQNPSEFTSSGTFTVPDGVTEVMVGICGGGGGGLSGDADWKAGGGGSAMTYHKISVNSGDAISITIGAGGGPGVDGGSSSFGNYVTVDGGLAGGNDGNDMNAGQGRNGGGTGGGGGVNGGTGGTNGQSIVASKVIKGAIITKTISGGAGAYRYGGGGAGGGFDYEGIGACCAHTPNDNKLIAKGYGAGGAGAYNNDYGHCNGTDGICVIWY